MTCRVRLTRSARRVLGERLPESVAAAVHEFLRGPLTENPRRVGKPLQRGLLGLWSARRGEYRIVYEIHEDEIDVLVVAIDHRRVVYRPS